jgi:hypothetical protein
MMRRTIATSEGVKEGAEHTPNRPLFAIAREIYSDWGRKINYAAEPYLREMARLTLLSDDCGGGEDGRRQVIYFLNNAGTWRGEVARRIKAELKSMLNRETQK